MDLKGKGIFLQFSTCTGKRKVIKVKKLKLKFTQVHTIRVKSKVKLSENIIKTSL